MTEPIDVGGDRPLIPNAMVPNAMVPTVASTTVAAAAPWVRAVIALGGNLGNSRRILTEAVQVIDDALNSRVLRRSHLYRTAPVGPPQPDYLNACILIETTLTPRALLQRLLAIENQFGRVRKVRWGARSLDLDLLLFGDQIVDCPGLTVPHPRLHERAFVLVPLMDIVPSWRHPIFGKTIAQLSEQIPMTGVERLSQQPSISP